MTDAFWVGVPRYSILRVKSDGGELIREYDRRDIPTGAGGLPVDLASSLGWATSPRLTEELKSRRAG